jgi:hypothetical protein
MCKNMTSNNYPFFSSSWSENTFFFCETQYRRRRSHICTYTHPYEHEFCTTNLLDLFSCSLYTLMTSIMPHLGVFIHLALILSLLLTATSFFLHVSSFLFPSCSFHAATKSSAHISTLVYACVWTARALNHIWIHSTLVHADPTRIGQLCSTRRPGRRFSRAAVVRDAPDSRRQAWTCIARPVYVLISTP